MFKFDPEYAENEDKYKEIKTEILGDESDEDESGDEGDVEDESDEEPDDGISELQRVFGDSNGR